MSTRRSLALLCAVLTSSAPALGQSVTPPAKPDAPLPGQPGFASPNAQTPPGGVPRGVVPAPRNVDPGMVERPPAAASGTMPVIPPPAAAR